MNNVLETVAIFVAVVGGFKALEWVIDKITKTHDKSQKIDENADNFAEYKKKTDEEIARLQREISNAHNYTANSLEELKKDIVKTLEDHREEYINGINEVKQSVTEMSSVYQQTVAIIEVKIDNLEKKQDKHNSVIERTYELEKQVGILQNRESVSEHRLSDIEGKMK